MNMDVKKCELEVVWRPSWNYFSTKIKPSWSNICQSQRSQDDAKTGQGEATVGQDNLKMDQDEPR